MLALLALLSIPAPAFLTVTALTERRAAAFLVRGSVERGFVLGAAALAGAALLAELSIAPELELAACAPALGAVPWVAGEILSGPSAFRTEALLGAVAAAQVGIAAGAAAGSPLAGALLGALAAAGMYLEARGPEAAGSTIYES